ncbi:MAG: HEAT repeat domain-containing protein [Planctomycetota bacterium]
MIEPTAPLLLALAAAASDPGGDAVERAQQHYRRVEQELRERGPSTLAPTARQARVELLDELGRYRDAGAFTQPVASGARVPVFVDDGGRHCAVANLLRFTGDTELVERVTRTNNHAWVAELGGDPEFEAWLLRVGLTFDEAARIQVPSMGGGAPSDLAFDSPPATGPSYGGPANTPGSGGGSPSAPATPGPGLPGAGPAASTPGPTAGPTGGGSFASTGGGSVADWQLWWEFNKLEWMRPRPLAGRAPATGDGASASEAPLEAARRRGRQLLVDELEADHPAVRGAAAMALARAAGAGAVPALEALLDDPTRHVRLSALFALAATGSEEGVHALLSCVAADEEPAPGLRAAAVVALGAAQAEGNGDGVERMLSSLLRERGDDELYALFVLPSLAPDAKLLDEAKERSGLFTKKRSKRSDTTMVSTRAVEALRFAPADATAEVLPRLLDAVGARSPQARRSAALALGDVQGAREPLMTAFELEKEPLARGFLLLSIARRGGEEARAFLVRELEHGALATRAWCALALGVLAATEDDDEARRAVREAFEEEKKRPSRGAFLLAMGVAGDREAEALLVGELASKSASNRSYAAQALGLLEAEAGREALRKALVHETTPVVRAAIAQALAQYGDERDAEALRGELAIARDPLLRMQVAVAVGSHGTTGAVNALFEALDDEALRGESRAAALAGLAIALSGRDKMTLGAASAGANHAAFPAWFVEVLQQPL